MCNHTQFSASLDRDINPRRKRNPPAAEKRSPEEGDRQRPLLSVGGGGANGGLASSHHALAAQLLAELGKSEMGRGVCLQKEVTRDLERALKEQVSRIQGV